VRSMNVNASGEFSMVEAILTIWSSSLNLIAWRLNDRGCRIDVEGGRGYALSSVPLPFQARST